MLSLQGPRFDPWLKNSDPTSPAVWPKKKKKKNSKNKNQKMLQGIFPAKEKRYQIETESIIHILPKKKKKVLKMVNICGRYNTPFFFFFNLFKIH